MIRNIGIGCVHGGSGCSGAADGDGGGGWNGA